MNDKERSKAVQRVLIITLILNLTVSLLKIIFGLIANSISMVADGGHSLFDGVSNIVGLVAIRIASKPPDAEHPYGHRKYETFATIGIAILILITCFEIIESAFKRLPEATVPEITALTFSVMVITLLTNIFVSWYESKKGKELKSEFLIADSHHTRTDIFVSISVILGFVFIKLGQPIFDPVIAIMVAILIGKLGYEIIKESSHILCDVSVMDPNEIKKIAMEVPGIVTCHKIRTRGGNTDIYMDLHICIDPKLSVEEGHNISHRVESLVKKRVYGVKDITIHIEPIKNPQS